jgi:hypothetical protein
LGGFFGGEAAKKAKFNNAALLFINAGETARASSRAMTSALLDLARTKASSRTTVHPAPRFAARWWRE